MTSNDQDMTDDGKNSFGIVAKIYEETSFLLKSFREELKKLDFVREENLDDGIGIEGSKSIREPEKWLPRYASWFFKRKGQNNKKRYVWITAIFCDEDGEPITPCLVTGVIETSQEYSGLERKKYGILYHGYLNAKDKFDDKDREFVELDTELDGKGGKKVSVKGSVIAQPLLQINSAGEVKNLAQRMVDCWTEKFGEV